ncbi:TetR/AcrR family transcriptional regulator [Streptomyces sp. Z26]|uniref:TetR/AcrR family transcriptional regulator n=1 Tax=Streptomyces TaxID=1883 RepID=UPI000EF15CD6|nr:TetR/AcrR family transcriptional regulator [Streptomyces sp. Z26]RLL69669.1 TetR/AcrR family transcriptional regulator [Streptomyces sp. Z26]
MERRTQSERRAESRERLVNAAIRLLAEHGYAHTSLARIGGAAGLSRGLVSHHFGSKEACMRAVVEECRTWTHARIEDVGGHGVDALDAVLDVYFDGVRQGDTGLRAMSVILVEALTATPGLRPVVAETNAETRRFIAARVAEMLGQDPPEPDGSPEVWALATLVQGLLRGVSLQWMADPENVDLPAAVATAKTVIRAAVAAYGDPARAVAAG